MKLKSEWLDEKLGLEYQSNETDIWLESSITLRKLIGVLGILLPILLWFFLWMDTGRLKELESISHYYYTRVDGIFIVIVSLVAIFLIVYKGKEPIDFYLSLISGISALILLLFPTSSMISQFPDAQFAYSNTILDESTLRVWIHYLSAGLFLFVLALMSLFLFTKSNKSKSQRGRRKIWRNRIYRICGIGMIAAILIIAMRGLGWIDSDYYDQRNLTFWMEVIAVELFGISWLVKGETLLTDN